MSDLSATARDAALQVLPSDPSLDLDLRQGYVVSINWLSNTATIRFPESTADIAGVHWVEEVAANDTIWVIRKGPTYVILGKQDGASVPPGAIMMWVGNTAPAGWIFADGQSTTGYTRLAAIYGASVPNLTDRFPVGAGGAYGIGATGGAATVSLSQTEMPSHSHAAPNHDHNIAAVGAHGHRQRVTAQSGGPALRNDFAQDMAGQIFDQGIDTALGGGHTHSTQNDGGGGSSSATGGGGFHENRPPYYALRFIVKL